MHGNLHKQYSTHPQVAEQVQSRHRCCPSRLMEGLAAVRRETLEAARDPGHVLVWRLVEVQALRRCLRCWTANETAEASRVLWLLAGGLDQAPCGASRWIRGLKSGRRHGRRGRASLDAEGGKVR